MAGGPNMAISTASRDYPAGVAGNDKRRRLVYGVVVLISSVLHLTLWQFRGVLEWRAEPPRKVMRSIEVSLAALPPPKTQEPPAPKEEHRKVEPKSIVAPKPVTPPRPKPLPKPKPIPKPVAEPKPVPKRPPAVAEETLPKPREEISSEPITRPADAASAPAAPRRAPSGNAGEGKAEENAKADYLHNPKPAYPAVARQRHWTGRVVLKVQVQADGSCGHAEISQSSGHDVLDEAALEAVSRWRFSPAKRGGRAVDSTVNVPINFNLEG